MIEMKLKYQPSAKAGSILTHVVVSRLLLSKLHLSVIIPSNNICT